MYIFIEDYKGSQCKMPHALNLAHMRSFYIGTDSRVYFEYKETFEYFTFDTQENALFAYQSIVGMIKALQ